MLRAAGTLVWILGTQAAPAPVQVPSFTSGFLAPAHLSNKWRSASKRDEVERAPGSVSPYRPSWQFGKREPWTGSWANIMWRPDLATAAEVPSKRSPWTTWASLWPPQQPQVANSAKLTGVGLGKRSPKGWYRVPQGFRFYDEAGAGDWFSRDLVQKRPVDFTSNLNSVPMMGKREPEAVQQSDNNPQFVEEAL